MLKMKNGYEENFFDSYIKQNYIPQDNPLVKVKEFLSLEFLESLVKDSYKNDNCAGRDPIDPRVLFMILLLEHIQGLSDVQAAKQLKIVPLYRYFVGLSTEDNIPDDTTISFFRVKRMGEEKFKSAFDQIVKQLFDAGLIDGKIQSQDATNIRGDIAILDSFELLNKCRNNVLMAIERIDKKLYKQKFRYKFNFRAASRPKDKQAEFEKLIAVCRGLLKTSLKERHLLKDKRLHREIAILNRAVSERKDEYFDIDGKKQIKEDEIKIIGKMINPSDPDVSWGAKSDKKFFAGYKVESNMDHKYGIITALAVEKAGHPEEKSAGELLKQQKNNINISPEHFVADAKYDFGNTRVELKAAGAKNIYIPLVPTKNRKGGFLPDDFQLENGNLICPAGYPAQSWHADDKKMGFEFCFNPSACSTCELKPDCTSSLCSGRKVFIASSQLERNAVLSLNASEEYALMMKGERYKIEPRQADLKNNHGLKRARYRGLLRVRIQAYLAVIVSNLKKWFKFSLGLLKDGSLRTLSLLAALAPRKGEVCPEDG